MAKHFARAGSRRAIPLRALAALCAAPVLLSEISAGAEELTVVSWGGSYVESQQRAYGALFEAETGRTVVWEEYRGGLDEIRAQVASGDVAWDVVDVFGSDARAGCAEGLFERLPPEFYVEGGLDDDLLVGRPNDCVGPNIVWSWTIAYDVQAFADAPPTGLTDFFDLERYPGTRALGAFPQSAIEMALIADGVAPEDVYDVLSTPEGVRRAFAKLDTLRGHVVFWSSGEEPIELLRSGDVAMATGYNGRFGETILGGEDGIAVIWDGQVIEEEWFVIVKGAEPLDDAIAFLRAAADPNAQAEQARWITYGPMRASSMDIIAAGEPWFHTGEPVVPHLPTTRARLERSVVADPAWWAEHGEEMSRRYAAWRRSL